MPKEINVLDTRLDYLNKGSASRKAHTCMEVQNTEKENKDETSRLIFRTVKTYDIRILTIHRRYERHKHQGFVWPSVPSRYTL
jgi:hypothetical protein